MTEQFDVNLELWAKERPVEAIRLQMEDFTDYLPFTSKEMNNLKMPWGGLYSDDPKKEAEEWFKGLDLKNTKLIYVYGVGLGYYYETLTNWLKQNPENHVVFVEDDLGVLVKFLETKLAFQILSDSQANVCYVPDVLDSEGVLETLYWSFVLTPFVATGLKSYQHYKQNKYTELTTKLLYDTTMKNALIDEYLHYGASFFRNFYPNILELHKSRFGNSLFGKFQGIPAIICGAGPSLEKQLPLLKELNDKAILFAGGSSLNAITAQGILPHFGAGIDPNPTQALRLSTSQAAGVPFFYRSRMMRDAFRKIPGERLYISGSGGYDVSEIYEDKFGLKAEFLDEGHNVVNFCTEIACRMGCNPIIYVGMDLAYTGMKSYSGGIEDNVTVSEEALMSAQDEEYRGVRKEDIYGKPTFTLWKWVAEADWLSNFSKTHPECKMINATEGGIGFPGIENISFQKCLQDLTQQKNLKGKIQTAIDEAAIPQVTEEEVVALTHEIKESLIRSLNLIRILREELEAEKKDPNTDGTFSTGRAALAETDLYEEMAYKYILDIFHQIYVRVQNKKLVQLRINKNERLDAKGLALEKINLQLERLDFLHKSADANIVLIDWALENRVQS